IDSLKSHNGSAVLKFEPFIMHVLCSTMESAKKLHAIGIQSGFRNSGLTVGKSGKITMAIRGTLSLEIPLSHNGVWLVSDEVIKLNKLYNSVIMDIIHLCKVFN
ncbi:tRNA wybutosine-synthesizing protein 3 homolog, partial [Stegodyphus dumicola]|uniref:tRNA wybutosine-synthesizing protein 3 homolog n=1 Tax=Stegodyphus dumicola TaxID=202533 RepID=UPI0015B071FD